MAQYLTRLLGKTVFGILGRGPQQVVHITAAPAANKPGILALDSVDGSGNITTRFFWCSTAGVLRYGTAIPTNVDTDGAAV